MPASDSADLDILLVGFLEVHHPRAGGGDHRLGDHEGFAEASVEPLRDVTGQLDVLALVVADRHPIRVVQEDVGGLQRRVGEQPGGDELLRARRTCP